MRIHIFVLALVLSLNSVACLNYLYSVDASGKVHETSDILNPYYINFNLKKQEARLQRLSTQLEKDSSYEILSDYAIALLKTGHTNDALEIFKTLSHHYPDNYSIASNLGTAYELAGNNDSALVYIKKGIELNPNSHRGSEWVHEKILEAKLMQEKDSSYLDSNLILNLTTSQLKDDDVRVHIEHQLRERFPFSPAPNKVIGRLLEELGDCYSQTLSIEYAKALYTMAIQHHKCQFPSLLQKRKDVDKKLKQNNIEIPRSGLNVRDPNARDLPEEITQEGDHNRIGYISYKQLLRDRNESRNVVSLSVSQSSPDSLLPKIGLTRYTPPSPIETDTASADTTLNVEKDTEKSELEKLFTWRPADIWGVIAFVFSMIGVFVIWLMKKRAAKNQE